jgi:hypothetical protein
MFVQERSQEDQVQFDRQQRNFLMELKENNQLTFINNYEFKKWLTKLATEDVLAEPTIRQIRV